MGFVKTTLAVALGVTIPTISAAGLMLNKRFVRWSTRKVAKATMEAYKEVFKL